MKEFIDKLIGRLKELTHDNPMVTSGYILRKDAIELIKELAEEYEREHIVDLCNQFCDKADEILQKKNNGWIPCSERLPEDGQQVLVYYNNCLYSCMSVAKFRKGKTKEELQSMEWPCFGSADQWGNNLKPYAWFGDGPMEWFGQEIIAWQPLPEPYRAPTEEKIKKT